MDLKHAPLTFGSTTFDAQTVVIAAIVAGVILAFMLGAKKETAMFAVFAGVIGVILAI